MMIRAANLLAEARRIPGMAGASTVHPDWALVAARIREAAHISIAQPDHHLARPAPVNHRCRASGSEPSPGSCRAFSECSANW